MYAAEGWVGDLEGEPYIRRRRPKRIIGWKRLLEGRWNDPIVARDMLLGAGFGAAMVLLEELRRAVPGAAPFTAAIPALSSRLSWLELLFYFQTRAIFYSLFGLFLLLLLRAILRKTLIASAVWVIALAVLLAQAEQRPPDYILGAALALILLLLLNPYRLRSMHSEGDQQLPCRGMNVPMRQSSARASERNIEPAAAQFARLVGRIRTLNSRKAGAPKAVAESQGRGPHGRRQIGANRQRRSPCL